MKRENDVPIYFTDIYHASEKSFKDYGAFNISLIADLPLFIDPFLLFQSNKAEYQALHKSIVNYLSYLRDLSHRGTISLGRLQSLFFFSEVKQTYLGFSEIGNSGRGLGQKFALALNRHLISLFTSFGKETITQGTHLEKLSLISPGVGKDMISDFTTNLIKEYLCEYTQNYCLKNIESKYLAKVNVPRVKFNYELGVWISKTYFLPIYNHDYVLLTPKDILTKQENWINRDDFYDSFYEIINARPNHQLRAELNEYLKKVLSKRPTEKEKDVAVEDFIKNHPELIDLYIRIKEEKGELATRRSAVYVSESETLYIKQFSELRNYLFQNTLFYQTAVSSEQETLQRITYLKDAIENKGCWKLLYKDGKPLRKEEDIHIMFRLVWYGTTFDVSREVNDGRGPADYKVSMGLDKTVIEFKLANNSHLKQNLQNQLELYKKASDAQVGFKVIVYFTNLELAKVQHVLKELGMLKDPKVILIDARNKLSASKVR
ncbi:hypothetical protein Dform_00376 [Dehalogenimonas formicexedens]|uniref:Uncharacterized protein n=1 Tax=Dehalogenimonas formicexedens TaxID=1839801 RepID=A0A1P8F5L8_9CHLR|nr:hypothetical protein [Dehalogenimonas formicexedens]APV43735.1 hypothetical protein Dform_00376 [Dehalogenimonas formicexedens]